MDALVVDDSAFMRNMMKGILEDMNFDNIYEGENGQEAIELHKEKQPDLVTLDIVMDEMSGIDALEEIKKQDDQVKVIMVSAVGQDQMIEEAQELGAETFVDKPFDEDEVKDTVTDLIV